jgi:hypothetical protein
MFKKLENKKDTPADIVSLNERNLFLFINISMQIYFYLKA